MTEREKGIARMNRLRAQRRAAGICIDGCGQPALGKHWRCRKHLIAANKRSAASHARRAAR